MVNPARNSVRQWLNGGRRGQVIVLCLLLVAAVVIVCVLTVDVGRAVTSQAELQNAVDAAALAGASQLVGFGSLSESQKQAAKQAAVDLAAANRVAGEPLTLAAEDVVFGRYIPGLGTDPVEHPGFKPESQMGDGEVVDSIMVQGRRTYESPDGPIELFFASLFGFHATAQSVRAVGTKPQRYIMFVMDRSGSMCYDTSNIAYRYQPNEDASMDKSPSQWYWMPKEIYKDGWQVAWMYARNDSTGETVTDFLPDHIKSRLSGGVYFRYCSKDRPDVVQSGWLKVPSYVTVYSAYGADYPDWTAESYGPIGSCDYAMANDAVEPITSSQNAAMAFVDLLQMDRDQAGLVSYAWYGTLDHDLTDDWASLKQSIAAYDSRGATATPDAMEAANDEFIESGRAVGYGQRVMILLTDGMANTLNGHNYGNPSSRATVEFFDEDVSCYIYQTVVDAIEAQTRRALANGIRIYTVSFGEDADQDLMPLIARETGGTYYYAADHENLTDIFLDIFHHLPAILTR